MEYLRSIYPKIYSGQNYDENQPKFPYVHFFLGDMPTALDDLSNNEVGVKPMYQIDIYTNAGQNQARKIAMDVRTFMISNGFKCRNFMPIINGSNVSRFVSRYVRLEV